MAEKSVEELREELRRLGYLSRGLERWFLLDSWSSRTFWAELALLAAKAGVLAGVFLAIPMIAIMLWRNRPVPVYETLILAVAYLTASFVTAVLIILMLALLLRIRPSAGIERPGTLTSISLAAAAILCLLLGTWWIGFGGQREPVELMVGIVLFLLLFAVASIVISAALLSFSIHETKRIPTIHQRSRTAPISLVAVVLLALLFVPNRIFSTKPNPAAPPQIVVSPRQARMAIVGVDGLSSELLSAQPELAGELPTISAMPVVMAGSSAERWATIGSGVLPPLHGVRSIEGLRLRATATLLQSISNNDFLLQSVLPALGLATRVPLPPTVRKRDYLWEILANRGVEASAVNWWAGGDRNTPSLALVSQEQIFTAARKHRPGSRQALALFVDETAIATLRKEVISRQPALAAVYLPALDVVLNRLELDGSTQIAASVRALEGVVQTIRFLREKGYEIMLVGLPGEGQSGQAVLATTLSSLSQAESPLDMTPTALDLFGFPASREMPGHSKLRSSTQQRIDSYGSRQTSPETMRVNQEYFESLRSLGYIR